MLSSCHEARASGRSAQTLETLEQRLRERIRREGPITFYEWMKAALYDPIHGYYCRARRRRQGRSGDYRTAPELSPLFAATFADYFAKLFSALESPHTFTICEAGAGEGEFAFGVLRNLQKYHPDVFHSTTYMVDEVSSDAGSRAAARLAAFNEKIEFRSLGATKKPFDCGIIFSNELIDALPVHRVVGREGNLQELCVDWKGDRFIWIGCDVTPPVMEYLQRWDIRIGGGQIIEVNLDAERFISLATSSVRKGFIITVDYGAERAELLSDEHRFHGTLRAFRRHQLADDPLSHPGEQDLTTTIDWTQIREAGQRAALETVRFERLDQFLLAEGLLEKLEMLADGLPDSQVLRLRASVRELIMPDGMAPSFQVLVQRKK
jgi:SAM-dependent MidA family methyltransferase